MIHVVPCLCVDASSNLAVETFAEWELLLAYEQMLHSNNEKEIEIIELVHNSI